MQGTTQSPIDAPPRRKAVGLVRRLGRVLLVAMVAVVVVSVAGFVYFSAEVSELRKADTAAPADGIVVLTGGKSRIETALQLLGQGLGRRLLISGVHPRTSASAIRRAVGGESRLFDCCVDIDRAALDTFGNAEEAGKWAHRNGFASLIVVTSDYHMPRSLMEMRSINPDIRLVPHLVPTQADGTWSWVSDPDLVRVVASEYLKFIAAAIRVRIEGRATPTAVDRKSVV